MSENPAGPAAQDTTDAVERAMNGDFPATDEGVLAALEVLRAEVRRLQGDNASLHVRLYEADDSIKAGAREIDRLRSAAGAREALLRRVRATQDSDWDRTHPELSAELDAALSAAPDKQPS